MFLLAAAIASDLFPSLHDAISFVTVERIAVLALIVILFDGGMHIGWHRAAVSIVPILSLGVLGTFATAGLVALGAHWLLGFSWITSGLLGAAIAPTDPAVTFSVLSGREIRGRAGTIIEGESGANDPVGIALDDRHDRARDERRRQLLDGRPRVRGRDGGRCRGGRRSGRPCSCG